ncbi:hypothetical protein [Mesoflavibacter zeaxanthinifaciens]|uniref:hypothetical protein n=1 Tax=Mesoflavibacter zeaxanthinifaciens TaxID=393060 RepID=UPI003A90D651
MKKMNISDKKIEMIQNDLFDNNFWVYQLGLSLDNEDLSVDKRLSFDFYSRGKEYFEEIVGRLKTILCDDKAMAPKEKFELLVNDNSKSAIVLLVTAICDGLDVAAEVGISIAALALRKGLIKFCS